MAIIAKTLPNTWQSLGLAAHFVARHEPFGGFPARDLIRTLSRQIERGHYLFAFDTSQDPARIVGFFGWALYDDATAEQFIATGKPPAQELASGGDVIWILTAAVDSQQAFRAIVRAARAVYPHHRVLGIRYKDGKRVVIDQSRARVAARTTVS